MPCAQHFRGAQVGTGYSPRDPRTRTARSESTIATHVFFDFFGTLVDYDPSPVGTEHNAPLAYATAAGADLAGAEADTLWSTIWAELDAHADETGREWAMVDAVERFRDRLGVPDGACPPASELIGAYLTTWSRSVAPAAGLDSCLQNLSADHRLCVVSNTHDTDLVPGLLARFGIADRFDAVIASVDVGWRKPNPEIFRFATESVGVEPEDAVFVGDSWRPDVVGPRSAGMNAVFVGAHTQPTDDGVTVVDSLHRVPDAVRSVRTGSLHRR
ncbi:HAD family hydrolase [Prescottella subtropica]|uniref:HAD family hydrolase n=1 Tax=Prescottella subtropica TaxID=2545757 RepID=UPI0013867278|nr:HAD family hydrolase [Prescottella subtropica]